MTLSTTSRLRVGILGASKVLRKTWLAIREAGHDVAIIGCRDTARGQASVNDLCKDIRVPQKPLVGTYEEVVSSPSVDVVYMAIPVSMRHRWVLECVHHGKHIVCEKPVAHSATQLLEWLQLLAPKRLLFMDGTALSHGRRVHEVRTALREIGRLRRMEAHFAFPASDDFMARDIRMDPTLEPTGALGDLGWYCVRYFLHMLDFALPSHVLGRVAQCGGPKSAITAFSGQCTFVIDDEPVTASFFCSFHTAHEQLVRIKGDDGILTVHGAINPTDAETPSFTIERNTVASVPSSTITAPTTTTETAATTTTPTPKIATTLPMVFHRHVEVRQCAEGVGDQTVQLWRDVASALFCGDPAEPPVVVSERSAEWARAAWTTQYVCDKLLESAQQTAQREAQAQAEEIVREREKKAEEEEKGAKEKQKREEEKKSVEVTKKVSETATHMRSWVNLFGVNREMEV